MKEYGMKQRISEMFKKIYKIRRLAIWRDYYYDYVYVKNPFYVNSVHQKGFTLTDWHLTGLNKKNYSSYLSSKEYYKMHPINGSYSHLIDDKLTIKYILYGTDLDKYMPEYYYLLDENGEIFSLMNNPSVLDPSTNDLLLLVKEKGNFALKPVKSTFGRGFFKVTYLDNDLFVNGKKISEREFAEFVKSLRNYIVSEYLRPHPYIAGFWPETSDTIRYLIGRVNREWVFLKSYIRFGCKTSGATDSFNKGSVLCYINEKGYFHGGYVKRKKQNRSFTTLIDRHPDTGMVLDGIIPMWDEIERAAREITKLIPQMKYLGLDFVVTDDNKVKLLEINSLTSLDALQLDGSLLNTKNGKLFYSSLK